ncbi:hypothetical protein SteCoe_24946 [Stentor coeruleus]|uniref:Peptidase A1 domain-containing protein n=1 Tax=Stentor coeruleus TaxID=5963 RepID=A0A1R2BGF0_9CILI|nr:hypothetical protein SteCoe_24946 [Stentor coeruleus]
MYKILIIGSLFLFASATSELSLSLNFDTTNSSLVLPVNATEHEILQSKVDFVSKKLDSAYYYVQLLVGSKSEAVNFKLDFTSFHLWMLQNSYNTSSSKTFKAEINESEINYYGGRYIKGLKAKDEFKYLNNSLKKNNFIIASSYRTFDLGSANGIMGFGISSKDNISDSGFKLVKKKRFFELGDLYGTLKSKLYIEDNNDYKSSEKLLKIKDISLDRDIWEFPVQRVLVDNVRLHHPVYSGYVDIGVSRILLPGNMLEQIMHHVLDGNSDNAVIGTQYFKECADADYLSSFPDVYFRIEDKLLVVKPEHYIYYEDGLCYFLFKKSPNDFIVLGQPFMRQYALYFTSITNKPKIEIYLRHDLNDGTSMTVVAGLGLAIIAFAAGAYRKRASDEETKRYALLG